MPLRQDIDYTQFLRQVQRSQGDVWFKTTSGDCLNLKSLLSEYIFASAVTAPELIADGIIDCEDKSDYTFLAEYLEG